eukprot:CAMPEP_0119123924 /NCGR_PEP_ID=MMETSP1310-20130426/3697_1 /TAXON_ID=464262 /ORGANISM="Genus nov. species nov., Strain RCC2339" /LENGTH=308 /DNA_ID=CAMNT_0007113797 /DNA_START=275 /DNA_END=1198 /DNA_ORIENTATION=-
MRAGGGAAVSNLSLDGATGAEKLWSWDERSAPDMENRAEGSGGKGDSVVGNKTPPREKGPSSPRPKCSSSPRGKAPSSPRGKRYCLEQSADPLEAGNLLCPGGMRYKTREDGTSELVGATIDRLIDMLCSTNVGSEQHRILVLTSPMFFTANDFLTKLLARIRLEGGGTSCVTRQGNAVGFLGLSPADANAPEKPRGGAVGFLDKADSKQHLVQAQARRAMAASRLCRFLKSWIALHHDIINQSQELVDLICREILFFDSYLDGVSKYKQNLLWRIVRDVQDDMVPEEVMSALVGSGMGHVDLDASVR